MKGNQTQIENDEKFSLELFASMSMDNPIEQSSMFLTNLGIKNTAQNSLRQIMAEEEYAEKFKQGQDRLKKPLISKQFNKVLLANKSNEKQPRNIKLKRSVSNNELNGTNQKIDYYNFLTNDFSTEYEDELDKEYRYLAKKYFNLRHDYFKKASEAYQRGWGSVAQYYADMVGLRNRIGKI